MLRGLWSFGDTQRVDFNPLVLLVCLGVYGQGCNFMFTDFIEFMLKRAFKLVEVSSFMISDYLVQVAQKSQRPKAILSSNTEGVNNYFKAVDVVTPIDDDVFRLVDGLIKSVTVQPMRRTPVMPLEPFLEMFRKWGRNERT